MLALVLLLGGPLEATGESLLLVKGTPKREIHPRIQIYTHKEIEEELTKQKEDFEEELTKKKEECEEELTKKNACSVAWNTSALTYTTPTHQVLPILNHHERYAVVQCR